MKKSLKFITLAVTIVLLCLVISLFSKKTTEEYTTSLYDFPDPTAIYKKEVYYAYSTSALGFNIPMAISSTGQDYRLKKDALPKLPSWGKEGVWAPYITFYDKKYFLYFSIEDKVSNKRKIGVAVAKSPEGPFVASKSIVASADKSGGVIDPMIFRNNSGENYLIYKNDGNSINQPSALWLQKLKKDGLKTIGKPIQLLVNTDVENPTIPTKVTSTIEAPDLLQAPDGTYVLLFSGNFYASSTYFTGYAISKSLKGKYVYQGPLLTTESTKSRIIGPGGAELIKGREDKKILLLHGWKSGVGTGGRSLYSLNFSWKDGHTPVVSENF